MSKRHLGDPAGLGASDEVHLRAARSAPVQLELEHERLIGTDHRLERRVPADAHQATGQRRPRCDRQLGAGGGATTPGGRRGDAQGEDRAPLRGAEPTSPALDNALHADRVTTRAQRRDPHRVALDPGGAGNDQPGMERRRGGPRGLNSVVLKAVVASVPAEIQVTGAVRDARAQSAGDPDRRPRRPRRRRQGEGDRRLVYGDESAAALELGLQSPELRLHCSQLIAGERA